MSKRVKEVLSLKELEEVHRLNKKVMNASITAQVNFYGHEIDQIIERGKKRFAVVSKHKYLTRLLKPALPRNWRVRLNVCWMKPLTVI